MGLLVRPFGGAVPLGAPGPGLVADGPGVSTALPLAGTATGVAAFSCPQAWRLPLTGACAVVDSGVVVPFAECLDAAG
jgi:hypothetical protein